MWRKKHNSGKRKDFTMENNDGSVCLANLRLSLKMNIVALLFELIF
jgi:hypothetical protein